MVFGSYINEFYKNYFSEMEEEFNPAHTSINFSSRRKN